MAALALLMVTAGCGARQGETNLPSLRLRSLDGGSWNLHQEAGHIVVLQFFASFDNTSISLASELERLHIDFRRRGVQVIGVAMDPPSVPRRREVIEAFCALNNVTFDVMLASEALGEGETEIGRIPTIPATVVFNREGDPVASATGMFRRQEMVELLEAMIEGQSHPLLQPGPLM